MGGSLGGNAESHLASYEMSHLASYESDKSTPPWRKMPSSLEEEEREPEEEGGQEAGAQDGQAEISTKMTGRLQESHGGRESWKVSGHKHKDRGSGSRGGDERNPIRTALGKGNASSWLWDREGAAPSEGRCNASVGAGSRPLQANSDRWWRRLFTFSSGDHSPCTAAAAAHAARIPGAEDENADDTRVERSGVPAGDSAGSRVGVSAFAAFMGWRSSKSDTDLTEVEAGAGGGGGGGAGGGGEGGGSSKQIPQGIGLPGQHTVAILGATTTQVTNTVADTAIAPGVLGVRALVTEAAATGKGKSKGSAVWVARNGVRVLPLDAGRRRGALDELDTPATGRRWLSRTGGPPARPRSGRAGCILEEGVPGLGLNPKF